MNLCDLITRERIIVAAPLEGPAEVIQALGGLLAPGSGIEAGEAAAALRAREKLGSTAIGHGVAIPHARHDELHSVAAALILLARPIEFDAPDGEPVDVVFGVLTPRDQADLSGLSGLVKRLRNLEWVDELRQAGSASIVLSVLARPVA